MKIKHFVNHSVKTRLPHHIPMLLLYTTFAAEIPLEFEVQIGSDANYFIQSSQGSFHTLVHTNDRPKVLITSPAANSGAQLQFTGNFTLNITKKPQITGVEKVEVAIQIPQPTTLTVILGSVRTIRDNSNAQSSVVKRALEQLTDESPYFSIMNNWLKPHWVMNDENRSALLRHTALNGVDWYELEVSASKPLNLSGTPNNGIPEDIMLQQCEITLKYTSSFAPLTPFTISELLNEKATQALNKMNVAEKKKATDLINGIRFLAYKEKFLAGSWRFLTYFGRDTLISLRMLAPIVKPDVIEACIRGAVERLGENGEISHEEDLADQAFVDQIGEMANNKNFSCLPKDLKQLINVYNMVDENYLMVPLLADYAQLGGKILFGIANANYNGILKNLEYVLREAMQKDLVEIHKDSTVGDWRDSGNGLAYGRFAISVNVGHVPSALKSFIDLMLRKVFNEAELISVAKQLNLTYIQEAVQNIKPVTERYNTWSLQYKKFVVKLSQEERTAASNRHRKYIGLQNATDTPYPDGFLAISLNQTLIPIPIVNSDTIFALLDNDLTDEALNLALVPFETQFPNGLASKAGNLVTSTSMSPKKLVTPAPQRNYHKMLDRFQYHGEVIWAWHQVLLKIALEKQLGIWCPSITGTRTDAQKLRMNSIHNELNVRMQTLKFPASELWSWELVGGQPEPVHYGSGSDDASNAEQLWSVAALGPILWDQMRNIHIEVGGTNWVLWGCVIGVGCVVVVVAAVLIVWWVRKKKAIGYTEVEQKQDQAE